ncbi:lysozyme [Cupriavidus sp. 2TAF22]|uniref:lysozyme n=1 Tax=unclassified Cupriavidus TaxID=2640874 RepID=UPI003F8ECE52
MGIQQRIAAALAGGAVAIATVVVGFYEGRSNVAYLDPVGIPTICSGITAGVKLGQRKSDAECEALMRGELGKALAVVDGAVTVPLPPTRRAALASFVYNVGPAAFRSSTLLRKLNAGDVAGACAELSRWVMAKGRVLPGLVTRRQTEKELCLM